MPSAKITSKHQKLPEAVRRAAILEAAHKLFNQKGFAKTRMDDVAAMAGLTKGGLYFHFKDKQTLYVAVMFDLKERMEQIIVEISSRELGPAEMLSAYMFAMAQEMAGDFKDITPEGYPGAIEMFMEGHRLDVTRAAVREFYNRTRSFMSGVIEKGVQDGIFNEWVDPQVAAIGAVSMWVGLYVQCASDPQAFDLEEVAQKLINNFLKGLRRKAVA
jgi:TetR/AcrR family acrAB operon transcriptional repressor